MYQVRNRGGELKKLNESLAFGSRVLPRNAPWRISIRANVPTTFGVSVNGTIPVPITVPVPDRIVHLYSAAGVYM